MTKGMRKTRIPNCSILQWGSFFLLFQDERVEEPRFKPMIQTQCVVKGRRHKVTLRLTLMRWKLTFQLAPAREGMKRSPCLLGEDRGELLRDRTPAVAFCRVAGGREERER